MVCVTACHLYKSKKQDINYLYLYNIHTYPQFPFWGKETAIPGTFHCYYLFVITECTLSVNGASSYTLLAIHFTCTPKYMDFDQCQAYSMFIEKHILSCFLLYFLYIVKGFLSLDESRKLWPVHQPHFVISSLQYIPICILQLEQALHSFLSPNKVHLLVMFSYLQSLRVSFLGESTNLQLV